MTLKNRGRQKKTEGRTMLKSSSGSLAVGSYLQRGSAPPPPPAGTPGQDLGKKKEKLSVFLLYSISNSSRLVTTRLGYGHGE